MSGGAVRAFRKILIANRGEIAVRVMRACWDMDIRSVAVYSTVDRTAPHVRYANEACFIGPAPARESYLSIERILDAARKAGADAIHPGYGFLAENPEFAEACAAAGLVFIGPPASAMRMMGDKVAARAAMKSAGVPTLPGTGAFRGAIEDARRTAAEIGYPVMLKAAAGGGGKGMRLVRAPEDLDRALDNARSEARASFGDDTVYMEKYLDRPRHIEVQILFDQSGNGVAFGERECSIQRRHQKLVEESPSPVVDPRCRARLMEYGLAAGRAASYIGAGTVEFLRAPDGLFYFMEVNARLQVEHPVTEEVWLHDLVKAQIRVAAGEPLPWKQEDLVPVGHAIECRITAEDPERGFLPCPGTIAGVRRPAGPGIREDSAVAPGYTIPIEYDPMVAKVIAHGEHREEAIRRMRRALDEYRLDGLTTNLPFLRRLMDHPAFVAGDLHTGFIEEYAKDLIGGGDPLLDKIALLAASIHAFRTQGEKASRLENGAGRADGSYWVRIGRARALGGRR